MDESSPKPTTIPTKRRQYRACIQCKSKKMKCDLGDPDSPSGPPCARCKRELRECVFPADTGKPFSRKSTSALPRLPTASTSTNHQPQQSTARSSRMMESTSTGRDNIDLEVMDVERDDDDDVHTNGNGNGNGNRTRSPNGGAGGNQSNILFSSALHNPRDALQMLATASTLNAPPLPSTSSSHSTPRNPNSSDPRKGPGGWETFPPVAEGILEKSEAEFLLKLFKLQLSPLYSLLPPEVFLPSHLSTLTSTEYLLLSTIICVASRYCTFDKGSESGVLGDLKKRFELIHKRIAAFVRQQICFILDGSPALRNISSCESLLLLCEWPAVQTLHPFLLNNQGDDADGIQGILRYSKTYDSLSWSYIGCAVRVAQELGLDNANLYEPDNNGNGDANGHGEGWMKERALRTWIYCECDLQTAVIMQIVMFPSDWEEVPLSKMSSGWWETVCKIASMKFYASGLEHEWSEPMPQGFIASLLGTIHDRLYSNRELTRANLKTGDWERFLRSLTHEIQHMHRASESITRQGGVTATLLQIEIHYVLLYANTISLRALQIRSQRRLKALDIFSIAPTLLNLQEGPYILASITAAQKILHSTVSMFEQGFLQLAPARLFQRVLFAATFLFKALAVGVVEDSQSSTHLLLDQVIDALERASSQDKETLCSGFAALLRQLQLQVAPTSSSTPYPENSFSFPTTSQVPQPEEEYSPLQPFHHPSFHWGPSSELMALGKEQDQLFQGLWSTDVPGLQSQSFTLVDTLFGDEEWGLHA